MTFSLGKVFILWFISMLLIGAVSILVPVATGATTGVIQGLENPGSAAIEDDTSILGLFISFFTLGFYNPLGMPTVLAFLVSAYVLFINVLGIYQFAVLVRGGGNV